MEEGKYFKYCLGDTETCVMYDALHAASPKSDLYTGELVEELVKSFNLSGVISKVSRTTMDINRPLNSSNAPGIIEFREIIRIILENKNLLNEDNTLKKHFLQLSLHGMKNNSYDFEIGTRYAKTCSDNIQDWFTKELKYYTSKIVLNKSFIGDKSKAFHRVGDSSSRYDGYGSLFNTIQLEINHKWRKEHFKELVNIFSNVAAKFDKTFN